MRRPVPILAVVAVAAFAATPSFAHHSIASVYDSARTVTIEGRVHEFRFVNPHPILVVDVASRGGTQSWRLEMDNRSELARIGVTSDTLKAGEYVVATGSASRIEQYRLYLRSLERPADGFRYEQVGSRPRVSARRDVRPRGHRP